MPLCRSPLTLRLALFSRSRTAAVEIPRFILHRRRSEFLPLHRGAEKCAQSPLCDPCTGEPRFALSSPQRSLAQGSQEARSVRLADDREPRALPRRAQICRGGTTPSRCAATRGTPPFFMRRRRASYPRRGASYPRRGASYPRRGASYPRRGASYPPKGCFMCRRHA